jgi:hypothetical protein
LLADETLIFADRASMAAKALNKMLAEMKRASNSHPNTKEVILKLNEVTSQCNKESYLATVASKATVKACNEAQNKMDVDMKNLLKHAEALAKVAKAAAGKAKHALLEAEKAQAELAPVFPSTIKAFGSGQKHRHLSSDSSDEDDRFVPFGIQDVVLVDAETNQDVPGKPLKCQPANACFGSSKVFNFRADTYGPVNRVHISISGPISKSSFACKWK